MNRVVRILMGLICLEAGVLLVFLPWSPYWDQNFFLQHFPDLAAFLLSPFFRGAVTGLGLLDVILAGSIFIGRRNTDAVA
ncbi:MAG TPA: hypothetical protein VLW54_09165 [Candidatus Acidoferrales bacterium]|nr:hypothetical protein [Candidatus Acidoferrales bacterium]